MWAGKPDLGITARMAHPSSLFHEALFFAPRDGELERSSPIFQTGLSTKFHKFPANRLDRIDWLALPFSCLKVCFPDGKMLRIILWQFGAFL